MLRKIINDESGITTLEVLVTGVCCAIIAIAAYYGVVGGVKDASASLGTKIKNSVDNNGATW